MRHRALHHLGGFLVTLLLFITLRFLVGLGKYCVELVASVVLSLNLLLE